MGPQLSIVIPAFMEARELSEALPPLLRIGSAEVIVVDGGSSDGTAAHAARLGARVLTTPRCRGAQLDLGARQARGSHLFFLHADARPPNDFTLRIVETLENPSIALGCFSLKLDAPGSYFRIVERATALRLRITRTPYGDQGLFVRREDYLRCRGFPHWPLLEDLELIRRLRRHGRIAVLPDAILVSARRYLEEGRLRTSMRHRLASTLWMLRLPPPMIWSLLQQTGSRGQTGKSAQPLKS